VFICMLGPFPPGVALISRSEGPFECRNVTIQNNDIGPCGSDTFQEVSLLQQISIS
jgi:hypothetical protein